MHKTLLTAALILISGSQILAQSQVEGRWAGEIRVSSFRLVVEVDFLKVAGKLAGVMLLPQQTSEWRVLEDVRLDQGGISFVYPNRDLSVLSFQGELDADRIAGRIQQGPVRGFFSLSRTGPLRMKAEDYLKLLSESRGLEGSWAGQLRIGNLAVDFKVRFQTPADSLTGTFDIPQQGLSGVALREVTRTGNRVRFVVPSMSPLVFEGELKDGEVAGSVRQSGVTGDFRLSRARDEELSEGAVEALPYRQVEVKFGHGSIHLGGTLTLPRTAGPFAAIVLVTGSGPQNRDEEVFDFKPFYLIADTLTRHGIAVLRYDDRGVGASSGTILDATTEELSDDVIAAIDYLAAREDIRPDTIGVLGHNEGAMIGAIAATRADVAFLVMMAPMTLQGSRSLESQADLVARDAGADIDQLAANRELQRKLFAAVRGELPWESLEAEVRESGKQELQALSPERRDKVTDPEAFLDAYVSSRLQLHLSRSRWFRYYLDFDPAPTLRDLRCPVLAMFGEVDLQAPAEINRAALVEALTTGGHSDYTIEILPNANHLFLYSRTGSPGEYPSLKKEFVQGFLTTLADWVGSKTRTEEE